MDEGVRDGFKGDQLAGEPNSRKENSSSVIELTPLNIRNAERRLVIQSAAEKLDKEEPVRLPVDVVKCLVSRVFLENIQFVDRDDEQQEEVLWPESSVGQYVNAGSNKIREQESPIVYQGKFRFKEGIYDAEDSLMNIAFESMDQLGDDERREITKWVLGMHHLFPVIGNSYGIDFDAAFVRFINSSPNSEELFGMALDHAYDNLDEYHYLSRYFTQSEYDSVRVSRINDLVFNLAHGTMDKIPEYLEVQADDVKIKKLLGVWIDQLDYPRVINQFRKYMDEHPTDRERLERIGRMLIGADPDDASVKFHTHLGDIYKEVDFENYPANLAATEHEIDLLMAQIKDGDVILEKGCGAGRIANALAERIAILNRPEQEKIERGEEGKILNVKIIAFDSSEVNIKKAKAGDVTGTIGYFQGDWNNIPLGDESVDLIIDLGRNNTHAESQDGLYNALLAPARVLKQGGKLLVDWPDPNKGEYLENRVNYMKLLKSMYIPIDPDNPIQLQNFSYVYDGPDRQDGKYINVYNRYVPGFDDLRTIYSSAGLVLEELSAETRLPIEGWRESENIYFIATKDHTEDANGSIAKSI